MTSLLDSNLMRYYLEKLSKDNYVINSINLYVKQADKFRNIIEKANSQDDNEQVLTELKKTSDFIKKLRILLTCEISVIPSKFNRNNFDILTLLYLKENYKLFCDDANYMVYYERLYKLFENNNGKIDIVSNFALTLKSVKILDDLVQTKDRRAIAKYLTMLEMHKDNLNGNLINIIYYGLSCKEYSESQRVESLRNKKSLDKNVLNAILDNNNYLADNIIKHLCMDKQFKDWLPNVLVFIMNCIFMYDGFIGYNDYSIMINKILKNDVENIEEEALFYDLRELYIMFRSNIKNPSMIDKILSDIKCDVITFEELEEGYGSI